MDGLIIFAILFAIGLFAGRAAEKKHLADLDAREEALREMPISDLRALPGAAPAASELVTGEVTIASDYFKNFAAGLRNLIGGEVRGFETLQMRGRREALLRMREAAHAAGYTAVGNVRIETADIGGNAAYAKRGRLPMVSVVASGTAYHLATHGG